MSQMSCHFPLLTRDQCPEHLKVPCLMTGYRRRLSFYSSLSSLFYLHNQWCNIIIFVAQIPLSLYSYSVDRNSLSLLLLASCMMHTPVSIAYHTLMAMNADVRNFLKRADYACIFVMINMTSIAIGYYPFRVLDLQHYQYFQVAVTACLSLRSFTWTSITSTRMMRSLLVGATIVSALSPIAISSRPSWGLLSCVCYLAGGALWALHFPESVFPVHFDTTLNSHALMHIAVVLAHLSFYQFIRANASLE
jgi:predicted membrane channel-forming protein YqfA (hemolysin III family)